MHLDVKPRNFCIAYSPSAPAHRATGLQQVYIIDLEGTRAIPEAGAECQDDDFFGTVDYAGTGALLRKAVGPCDDLESLCYRCAYTCASTWLTSSKRASNTVAASIVSCMFLD